MDTINQLGDRLVEYISERDGIWLKLAELEAENARLREKVHELESLRSSDRFNTMQIYVVGIFAHCLMKSPRFKLTECNNGNDCHNPMCSYFHPDDPVEKTVLKKAFEFKNGEIFASIDRNSGKAHYAKPTTTRADIKRNRREGSKCIREEK